MPLGWIFYLGSEPMNIFRKHIDFRADKVVANILFSASNPPNSFDLIHSFLLTHFQNQKSSSFPYQIKPLITRRIFSPPQYRRRRIHIHRSLFISFHILSKPNQPTDIRAYNSISKHQKSSYLLSQSHRLHSSAFN